MCATPPEQCLRMDAFMYNKKPPIRDRTQCGGDSSAAILEARNITKAFGGLLAVSNVSFQAREGSITALIGPNGSGKTTVFNLISGLLPLSGGEIWFKGRRIDKLEPHQIAAQGIGRSFQIIEMFGSMSVLENVMVGMHLRRRSGIFDSAMSLPSVRKENRQIYERAMATLQGIRLEDKAFELALNLGLREQRLLEIGRALGAEASLLLLDEPAGGLSAHEIAELMEMVYKIRDSGVTILLVEHHVRMVMDIADWIVVLNYGVKIAEGTPSQVRENPDVIRSYLGTEI